MVVLGIIAIVAIAGGIAITQGVFHKTSDLRYDYEETLYYTQHGAVPYGDDHLFKIKVWNKSDEQVSLPTHFKFVFKDGTEIISNDVGHSHSNSGTSLIDHGYDHTLHTTLVSGEVEYIQCTIHVSGYSSKLPGKLVCTDDGWEQYDF